MWSKYPEIENELVLVEELIRKSISSRNKLLSQIVNELVQAGGKRLRPAFVLISAKIGRYDRKKALAMAGALEILHTATLVHDDIIDRSQLRRGRVTVSEKYGADMAVYTGDFLFTRAIQMLSKDISIDKLEVVAGSIKTICEGEVDQYQGRFNINTSVIAYLKRIQRKTAILFGAASAVGAQIGECPKSMAIKLGRFGLFYGMAFQIKDDINDFMSSEGSSGKPVEKDLREGVITLPIIYAIQNDSQLRTIVEESLQKGTSITTEDVMEICRLVREYKGVEEARKLQEKYIQKGLKELSALEDSAYKKIFAELIAELRG